jgi:cytochrome c5
VSQTDSSFLKILIMIIGGLFAFMIIIIIAANILSSGEKTNPQEDTMVQEAIEKRIAPVGQVNVGSAPAATASGSATASTSAAPDGKAIYTQTCFACHGTGAAGAPKMGDAAAWKPRIAQGKDTLYTHAIGGFKAMPPKGGNASLADADVKAAVDYMTANSQ